MHYILTISQAVELLPLLLYQFTIYTLLSSSPARSRRRSTASTPLTVENCDGLNKCVTARQMTLNRILHECGEA